MEGTALRGGLVVLLLLGGPARADDLSRAERLLEEGRPAEAESVLVQVTKVQPKNAEAHRLLGLAYRRLHRYGRACAAYEEAVRLDPSDQDAKEELARARQQRGPGFFGAIGEWEPDSSAATGWQAEAYYGGIDRLEAYAGVGYGDRYYYTRQRAYAKGYYFFSPTGYVKLTGGKKTYDYPVATNPVPDSNSYSDVPGFEVEVADDLAPGLRGTAAYEYFRPTFFYAPGSHANNHKLSGELGWQPSGWPLRFRVLGALLRDPDPDGTVIDRASGQLVSLKYGWQALLGGGAELDLDRVSALVLLIPNPDLDRSQSWALVTGIWGTVHGPFSARADYIRGRYSDVSSFAGQTSNVATFTVGWRAPAHLELSAGYKVAHRPVRNDSGPFATVRIRP
jgi:hypothetical protein